MNFELVRDAITAILGAAAVDFKVIGFQRQTKGAEEVDGASNGLVQVFYSAGQFGSARTPTGPSLHDMTFKVQMTVSSPASADLSVLDDPGSDPGAKQAVLAALVESAQIADRYLDALWVKVYNILMDARNYDFGLPKGTVANRWVNDFGKDDPAPQGELIVLTGSATLFSRTVEELLGATGKPMVSVQTKLQHSDDTATEAGVIVAGA